jgi:hypothetical protein
LFRHHVGTQVRLRLGTGANGKGTFLNTISAILGDYATIPNDELIFAQWQSLSRSKCRVSGINRPSTILRHGWHMPNPPAATTHLTIMHVLPTTAGRVRSGTGDAARNITIAR